MAKAELLRPFILKWEGGFVNDPLDRGGATNKGITIATFKQFFGQSKTVNDLKNMTDDQWLKVFKAGYWNPWKADKIENQSIANMCVDWGWSSGTRTAIKQVQKVLGVAQDGLVGQNTLKAINSANQEDLFQAIKSARIQFVNNIVKKRPSQSRFIKGWTNRINNIKF